MTQIKFTIEGNQKSPTGNAVPKLKMTEKQKWMPKAQEYAKWKAHVQFSLFKMVMSHDVYKSWVKQENKLHENFALSGKPIVLDGDEKAHMKIKIYWTDEKHGDPENIFGSIADALFFNDKHLSGEFHFDHDPGKGRVDVELTINQ